MKQTELLRKILHYLNLESEVDDYEKIHETIQRDVVFKGTNLWILMFAIIVASIGLNMNSTAVIIGAMLISPLMGPINGMGYSIATYNFRLFKFSVKNFTFAVIASLTASTLYFTLTPISTAHSELLARTSPTIYDVLIALFGGLAGIVAITSRFKGNVIPGVAIATALMPPLCTAGYGLATGQLNFFFGALYLFTINTVFIAISSVLISQILNFPIRTIVDDAQKKKVNHTISVVIAIVLIPSIYFGYDLIMNEKFNENAVRYINSVSLHEGNYLLKYEIFPKNRNIKLIYGGSIFTEEQKEYIRQRAKDFSLDNAKIEFQQGFSFDQLTTKQSEVENLKFEINTLKLALMEREKQLDSLAKTGLRGKEILNEIKVLFPQITGSTYSETFSFVDTLDVPQKIKMIVFDTKGRKFPDADKVKIYAWLQKRLNVDTVKVVYTN
ncbi:MAG TPA: DUF389 domain-containing protein [Ignavibacteriaceae bacterium]|nr:DUF389 domain-containing protein [Ignavibacteriaceae bacterium]